MAFTEAEKDRLKNEEFVTGPTLGAEMYYSLFMNNMTHAEALWLPHANLLGRQLQIDVVQDGKDVVSVVEHRMGDVCDVLGTTKISTNQLHNVCQFLILTGMPQYGCELHQWHKEQYGPAVKLATPSPERDRAARLFLSHRL